MYNYSPIKQLIIKNFRNLGNVTIDFSDSPIVSLIGENESGKTSVVKAFGVCAMHCDPRSQKDYIRDGTTEFGVAIILEDGTQIVRQKGVGTSSNRYKVVYPDGKKWEAVKLENDVPKAVQDVMGLIEEPETKELIHIRTYEDQLLFVVTPASTNYKVMYNALKISQLTNAIKAGSAEANQLKAKIQHAETSIGALRNSFSAIKTYDLEPISNIRDKVRNDYEQLKKLTRAIEISESIERDTQELGLINELSEKNVTAIDVSIVDKLNRVGNILSDIDILNKESSALIKLSDLSEINEGIITKINDAYDKFTKTKDLESRIKVYDGIDEVSTVSEVMCTVLNSVDRLLSENKRYTHLESIYNVDKLPAIDSLIGVYDKLSKAVEINCSINSYSESVKKIDEYTDGIIDWMKKIGVATTECPRCGEAVIIDLDKLGDK
ncbi:MAG: AAA family ATPase [Lachnospiraceae bacterium]|nr:AAA family ATPase [Lachnospiraceae bacterium]